jgi:hypothetical protein
MLDSFLCGQGYHLVREDSIHQKFASYYALLLAEAQVYIQKQISLLIAQGQAVDKGTGSDNKEDWVDKEESGSGYLAHCCQLCFGACAEHNDRAPCVFFL